MSHIMSVKATMKPGTVDDFAKIWKDFYSSHAGPLAGFQHAYYSVDRSTDQTLAVLVWSDKPDNAQLGAAMQEFSAKVGHMVAGPPTIEWFELLAEI